MSYTVIARRYRPRNFEEVVGQSAVATTLQNAIKENKVSHAYIFAGERGVGKTSMARILAKALNCKNGPTPAPCGKCDSCHDISEGNDPDVIEIDAASQNKIDDVRVLQEGVGYVPLRGRYKIYIMDEAHQLSPHSFNALLKTIEEPPPHVKFIFATTIPHKLPETIISRCQRFNFRRIAPKDIYEHLGKICLKEKAPCDKNTLVMIAQMANGSMRDAESVLDQLISFGGGKISAGDMESLLGTVSLGEMLGIFDAIHEKDLNKIITIVDDTFSQGKDMSVFISQMVEHLWKLVLVKVNPEDSSLVEHEIIKDKELYEKQAGLFSVAILLDYIQVLSDIRWRLREISNVRVMIEFTLLKMAHQGVRNEQSYNLPAAPDSIKPVHKPSDKIAPKANPVKKPETDKNKINEVPNAPLNDEPKQDVHAVNSDEISGLWGNVMEEIKKANLKVHAYLKVSRFVKADNQEIVIGFPPQCSFHRQMFDKLENKKVVGEYFNKVTGLNLPVTMIMLKEDEIKHSKEPGFPEAPPDDEAVLNDGEKTSSSESNQTLANDLLNNPIIRKIQKEFSARVIKTE
jgi:DNA polymerase-3 subunit gamma/tau